MSGRHQSTLLTIAWGVFCACSWTWCIGMYLPRIMIDRFGGAGFLVFAIPNVLGCAGFGYVLARRGASARMIENHGPAMVVFSLVAVAFHVFFATYLLGVLWGSSADAAPWLPYAGAAGLLVVGGALSGLGDRAWLVLAAVTYVLSLSAFAILAPASADPITTTGHDPASELAWLAPVIVIGFLLCPYLDLTFHRAVQRAPSHHAFAVFGATFTVMIVFTCFVWFAPPPVPARLAVAHIAAQAVFTVGAHLREARHARALPGGLAGWACLAAPLLAACVLPLGRALFDRGVATDVGSDMYLRFLGFYGLVFPAYVLVFIGPWRPASRSPRTLLLFAGAVVLLAPLMELGFIHQRAWVLVVPMTAVVAWAVARRRG